MNKRDLIDAISGRLGDKKSATEAVNAVLETIQSAVASGDKVAITGFGVFEKSERPARTARNPATGATIQVPKFLGAQVPRWRGLQGARQRREAQEVTQGRSSATAAGGIRGRPWTPPAAVCAPASATVSGAAPADERALSAARAACAARSG